MNPPDVPDRSDDRGALESLLRWYVAMGADAVLDADPHDRFLPDEIVVGPSSQSVASTPAPGLSVSSEALIRQAQAIAAGSRTLDDLHEAWKAFDGCTLASTASQMIFAGGRPGADLMIIGAAPHSDDERHGEAFAGPAGRLLDGMLRALGLSRESAYLANIIPWRPPGNRPPTPLEAALCLPFTRRHIALADPALILCLGERAAQLLLDTRDTMAKLRGRWLTYEGDATTVKLAATFSLDYLLSQPLQKKRAWIDLVGVAKMLEAKASPSR